jgi:hypothetical protein
MATNRSALYAGCFQLVRSVSACRCFAAPDYELEIRAVGSETRVPSVPQGFGMGATLIAATRARQYPKKIRE